MKFIDEKIEQSGDGENTEVIVDESQMLYLLNSIQNPKGIADYKLPSPIVVKRHETFIVEVPLDNNIEFLVGLESIILYGTEILKITDSDGVSTVIKLDYVFKPDQFGEVINISYKKGKVSIEFEVLSR